MWVKSLKITKRLGLGIKCGFNTHICVINHGNDYEALTHYFKLIKVQKDWRKAIKNLKVGMIKESDFSEDDDSSSSDEIIIRRNTTHFEAKKYIRMILIVSVLSFATFHLLNKKSVLRLNLDESRTYYQTYVNDGSDWNQGVSNVYQKNYIKRKFRSVFIQSKQMTCPNNILYAVLVVSHSNGDKARSAIRSTWGPDHALNVRWKTIFVTAGDHLLKKLGREMNYFSDILHCNSCGDSFRLTPPKVVAGLEWILKYCSVDYIVKVEDDTYINHVNLMKFLGRKEMRKKKLFIGNLDPSNEVPRRGKRKLAVTDWPKEKGKFRNHCFMSGVIMSTDVAQALVDNVNLKDFFSLEDIYLNDVIRNVTGIECQHHEGFRMEEMECKMKDSNFIMQHPATISCQHDINRKLLKQELL